MIPTDPLEELIQAVAQQDGQALRRLYDATSGRLLAIAQRVLDDRGAAEDVLQEVYMGLWKRGVSIPNPCRQPLAWLTTLVRNRAIDAVRRRRPEQPLQWVDADGEEREVDVADDTAAPPEQLEQLQEDARLSDCVQRIAEEPRQALLLAYYEGLTHQEVAERLARPLGTVKAWVRRSLLSLQTCLGGAGALQGAP
jgi:RNA polymerase sigma-70 factor (ECF subfamily)